MDVWRALPEGPLFRSARLDCALTRLSGALVCERERETLLALPYDEGAPFPLPELFCLARVDTVRGQRCVLYRLDEKKCPVMWEK